MIKKGETYDIFERVTNAIVTNAEWKFVQRATVTATKILGRSSGSVDYMVYFDSGFRVITTDWYDDLIWSSADNKIAYKATKVQTEHN